MLRGSSSGGSGGSSKLTRDGQSSARFSKQFNEFIYNLGDQRNVQYVMDTFPEGDIVLRTGSELLERVRRYADGSNEVRTAISQPTPENEEAAWRKIGPSVALLRECFEFAQSVGKYFVYLLLSQCALFVHAPAVQQSSANNKGENPQRLHLCQALIMFPLLGPVESVIPQVLNELCNHATDEDAGRSDKNRGLARLLADLMQNAFAFDILKSSIPAIQNDFSYYRRTLSRISKSQNAEISMYRIPQDVSNQMSLFYAYHNPMVKAVVDSATQFAKNSSNEMAVLDCLSALAAGSLSTVKHRRADSPKSEQMCVLVLVSSCVLYDWISPHGVVSPQSVIDTKAIIDQIGERILVEDASADRVLRANCKTLR
ncbi:hypothetical protein H4R24_002744 [Coemansia sp. RSA 988]|nr:hypothetical protein H4R24_002744 [Coemansia sp. RSA 988]